MRMVLLVSADVPFALAQANAWAAADAGVQVVLLDGAVAAARTGHVHAAAVADALHNGVAIAAHDDALRRRALGRSVLVDGVKAIDLDEVADLVAEGADRAVWL